MKLTNQYEIIDYQFLKAIDFLKKQVQKDFKEGTEIKDSYFGKMLYPSNRYFIDKVRNNTKSVPHMAMIALARMYEIDFNFFYDRERSIDQMFLKDMILKPVSDKDIEKHKQLADELSNEINSKFETATSILADVEDDTIRTAIIHKTESFVRAFKTLLKQDTTLLTSENTTLYIDEMTLVIHSLFEAEKESQIQKEKVQELQKKYNNKKSEIAELKEQLAVCYKDLQEISKVALEAQKGETAALRQLLER